MPTFGEFVNLAFKVGAEDLQNEINEYLMKINKLCLSIFMSFVCYINHLLHFLLYAIYFLTFFFHRDTLLFLSTEYRFGWQYITLR